MDVRQFPDFANTIEWNLVNRSALTAQMLTAKSYAPIPAQSFLIQNSAVVMIGVSSTKAPANWKTGGYVKQLLPFVPSSTSQFVAAVQTDSRWLRLGTLTLCVFPKILNQWLLELSFPYWLEQVSFEIWRYDGQDNDAFQQFAFIQGQLSAIKSSIDAIPL